MEASIKGNKLTIVIDCDPTAKEVSSTGKSRIVATSGGNQATTISVDGKPVRIGVNAYIPAK